MPGGTNYHCDYIAISASTGSAPISNASPTDSSSSWTAFDPVCRGNQASGNLYLGTVSGVNLNLINPHTINGLTYYFLDQNGNGVPDCVGVNPDDEVDHLKLNALFSAGASTTDAARSVSVSGHTLILPTTSELLSLRSALNFTPPSGWVFVNGSFTCNFSSSTLVGTTTVNGSTVGIHNNISLSNSNTFTNLYDGYGYSGLILIQVQ